MRVLVIGAGPMGIAAAIGAAGRGADVTLLERGEIGASLRTWGPTRFFSPLSMNVSPRMRELLAPIDDDALLTGPEYVEQVLLPLAESEPLRGRVRTGHRVVAIGRRGLTRGDYAGHPLRSERPFRVIVEGRQSCLPEKNGQAGSPVLQLIVEGRQSCLPEKNGQAGSPVLQLIVEGRQSCLPENNGQAGSPVLHDHVFEADVILDASGGLTVPRAIGLGGLPAPGESRLLRAPIRTLGELASRRNELAGRRTLVVGGGHSAANAIVWLSELAEEEPSTRVIWAVRGANRRPCEEVTHDPLPERSRVVSRANALAEAPPPFLRVERRASIESIGQNNGHAAIALTGGRIVEADAIAAFTGYRPEDGFLSELTVETSPVTEGGARLYRAISNITDCMSVPAVRPEDLQSGEPGFFFVGSRAYGRSNRFLLQTGLSQLETILTCIRP